MEEKKKAILIGPFVGELYWEAARFAPLLSYMVNKKDKKKNITYVVLTREDRFDLYGNHADILVPLKIDGDYSKRMPNCFRLNGFKQVQYIEMVAKFNKKYSKRFKVVSHIYPKVDKRNFLNKNQFARHKMKFKYAPRIDNYNLVDSYLPKNKPTIIIASRFRKGFKRNWNGWEKFYDLLAKNKGLMDRYNFIICGKEGEYVPDLKNRFYDMNKISLTPSSSLVGLLLVILERAFFTVGSQSAIPNMSLIYKVEVLEFGCQKTYHTKTYNMFNTPITFIENRKYNIQPEALLGKLGKLLNRKFKKEKQND